MSNNFGMFLLFSVLVTGLIVNPSAFAQETTINATDTIDMTESSNSTSTETTDTSSNSTSTEEEMTGTEEEMTGTEEEMTGTEVLEAEVMEETVLSPLKQIKEGIAPESIVCKEGLELVFKLNGQPACVKTTSIQKLIAWGWTQ